MSIELTPLKNIVIVQPLIKEQYSPGGIYLGEVNVNGQATVIAVANNVDNVKPGDVVLYNVHAIHDKDFKFEGQTYYHIHIDQIYGIVTE